MELVVDFSHYKVIEEVSREGLRETVIKGVTDEPVKWEFHVRAGDDDIPGILNVFFKPATLLFVIKNFKHVLMFFYYRFFKAEMLKEVDVK